MKLKRKQQAARRQQQQLRRKQTMPKECEESKAGGGGRGRERVSDCVACFKTNSKNISSKFATEAKCERNVTHQLRKTRGGGRETG